jgi:hypothetical protein
MTQNVVDELRDTPIYPFDPESSQWIVQFFGGGHHGTLDQCLDTLFDRVPPKVMPASYKTVRQRCIERGYVSIHEWVVCYTTSPGESTL